jgi:hypothetical protein
MSTSITAISLAALAAVACAGCGGSSGASPPSDIRIYIDATRMVQADSLEFYFCPPDKGDLDPLFRCDYAGSAFSGNALTSTVAVHDPSGHSPIPMAAKYSRSDTNAHCGEMTISFGDTPVRVQIIVGGSPALVITCPAGVCLRDNQDGCPDYNIP